MFIFKRSQNNNFTSEAWLCSPKSGCYVYSVLAPDKRGFQTNGAELSPAAPGPGIERAL